jgi:hypothetical protein
MRWPRPAARSSAAASATTTPTLVVHAALPRPASTAAAGMLIATVQPLNAERLKAV